MISARASPPAAGPLSIIAGRAGAIFVRRRRETMSEPHARAIGKRRILFARLHSLGGANIT
eukprot:9503995-Pyramimonas_sp.AAC.3